MDTTTLIVAILSLVASAIAAVAALLGLRKPKLTVESMFVPNSAWFAPYEGEVRAQQEQHEGPTPDNFLRITLRNNGWVPATRVSGRLHIFPSVFEPVNFPGYTDTHLLLHHGGPAYEARILPDDLHRAPPEPTLDPLVFEVPIRWHERDWEALGDQEERFEKWHSLLNQEVHISYRFVPEAGDPIEGAWIPALSVPPAARLPSNSGCVWERRLSWWQRIIERYSRPDERRYPF